MTIVYLLKCWSYQPQVTEMLQLCKQSQVSLWIWIKDSCVWSDTGVGDGVAAPIEQKGFACTLLHMNNWITNGFIIK